MRVDVAWPWVWRKQHSWSPRYRYRQRVVIGAGWLGQRRNSTIEVETTYRQRVRKADGRRAELDIYIDRIALYDRGRFLGEVYDIPSSLGRSRAYVYRDGRVRFDRDIFLVGNRYDGFEMISTRHYGGYVLNHYQRSHGYRAGFLDLRRERVRTARHSRFFSPHDFDGNVPLSLLPDDRHWLFDYGRRSISGYYHGDRYDDYDRYEDDRYDDDDDDGYYGYGSGVHLQESRFSAPGSDRLEREYRTEIKTNGGAVIDLRREATIELVQ